MERYESSRGRAGSTASTDHGPVMCVSAPCLYHSAVAPPHCMSASLRILFVAALDAGVHALGIARQGGPVQAQLAPSAEALRHTLLALDAATAWDAVVYVPGGPVTVAEVAAFMPDDLPLFVVAGEVPVLLAQASARALALPDLHTLHARLGAPTDGAGPSPDARTSPEPVGADRSEPAGAGAADATPEAEAPRSPRPVSVGSVDLNALAEHLTIGLYRSTADGEILYANPALARLLDAPSVDDLRTIDVRTDLGYPRDAFAEEIRATGSVRNLIVSWTRTTGERVHTRENAQAVLDGDGRVLYYEGTMEDVTAEIEAQQEERTLARQHRAIAAFAAAAAESSEPEALHQAAVTALLDGAAADWACLTLRDGDQTPVVATAGAPPPDLAALVASSDVLSGREMPPSAGVVSAPDEAEALRHAGAAAVGVAPVQSGDLALGVLTWGAAEGRDISHTDIRGAEALAWHLSGHLGRADALGDLRDTEASLAVIAERTPHVLYRLRYTPDGPLFDYLSVAIEALTGFSHDELAAQGGLKALIEHRDVRMGEGLASHPVPGEDRYHVIYRMETARGPRWVENDARPWLDSAGEAVGLVGVLQDITERKEREDQLADVAQTALIRQRALVDLAHLSGSDGFGAPAASVTAATLNAAAVSFWGCGPDHSCVPLHAPATPDGALPLDCSLANVLSHVAQHRALAISDARTDARVAEMDLEPFVQAYGIGSLLVAPIRRDGRVSGVVMVHHLEPHDWDSSETEFAAAAADSVALALERQRREQASQALATSQQRYQALAEMASDYAFAVVERDGKTESIQWATGACARVSGYTLDELSTPAVVQTLVHPTSVEPLRALAERWRAQGEARGEIQIITQSGGTRWLDHHARLGPEADGGGRVVYHSGQDVTLRKRDEAALVEARLAAEDGREAAERLNRLKTSFLANMSHEIRTPLTGILGFADLLSIEVPEEHRPFVAHIERNGRRLLDTLNAVLDLSQLDSGEYHSSPAPMPLAPIVETAADPYRKAARDKGLRFDIDLSPGVVASVDPAALTQIAGHVLSNAVKFTEAGGITVSVEGTADQAVLRVSDTGLGISEAFVPDAFNAFRQEEGGHARSHEGSGLGLAVVQRLVALLGGTVDIQSSQPGGTMVTVAFPRVAPPPSDRPPPQPLAERLGVSHGDGAATSAADLSAAASAVAPSARTAEAGPPEVTTADTPLDDLLGAPFDFTFLSTAAASASLAPTAPSEPPPTDMFDFRFGRSSASETPPAAEPAPLADPAPPASAPPAAPSPASAPSASVPPLAEPVMVVRARPDSRPPLPEAEATRPPEQAEASSDSSDDRPTILVVEDNDDTRMLLERILRAAYNVTAVGDARSALLAMNQQRFSGLVLDINLGGKETGADVLRIARSLPDYGDVFAIALTAYALPGDRERLLESGFNEYISKPFTRSSLMETLAAGVHA